MKIKIAVIILAVCIFLMYRQLEFSEIYVENNEYKVIFCNNSIYAVSKLKINKLIDEKILDFKFYDIDNDENDEILVITKTDGENKFGADIVIYDAKMDNKLLNANEIYRQDFSEIKPWKIDACNLDNDGYADIFIGVNKDTIFYKEVRNRPFFYSWEGGKLYKKWQGSFFTDWNFAGITFGDYFNLGRDTAAILEKNEDNLYRVGVYSFTGFGFLNITNSINYENIKDIKTINYNNKDEIKLESYFLNKNIDVEFEN
jgi:hypothetical protein